jgi:hypothetical protein
LSLLVVSAYEEKQEKMIENAPKMIIGTPLSIGVFIVRAFLLKKFLVPACMRNPQHTVALAKNPPDRSLEALGERN